jgi:excisionase family DNA binding protein
MKQKLTPWELCGEVGLQGRSSRLRLFCSNAPPWEHRKMDDKSIQNDEHIHDESIWKNKLLTVKEVSTYLRVSRVTVWRWCQQGIIPAFQIGRNWRIRRDELLNLEKHLLEGDDSAPVELESSEA